MRCQRVLSRLKALEDGIYCEREMSGSLAELMELLRRHEEDLEKLRSMPGYTVDWEVQIAKEVVRDLIKKGLIDGAGADDFLE
jgi:hypothetical protein